MLHDVLEQNPVIQQGVLPTIDGKQHVVHFKYDADETAKYKKARKKVKEIVKDIIKDQMSDREKIEAINRYLIEHVSYDKAAYQGFLNYKKSIENKESEEAVSKAFKDMQDGIRKYESSFDITGPLFEGKGVCQAYAVTFQALAQEAGLETMYVSGNTDDFDPHAWNFAKVDGQWLALDVTWNDSDGDSNKKENEYLLLAMDDPIYAQTHYAFDRYEDAIKE